MTRLVRLEEIIILITIDLYSYKKEFTPTTTTSLGDMREIVSKKS